MEYVLITGCNGFIGSRVTKTLLNKGYNVIGISKNGSAQITNKNFRYIRLDLTDALSVEKLFYSYRIPVVIHLAAIAHYKHDKNINWNDFYRINTLASKTLFDCAKKNGADVFYSSTVDVYGNSNGVLITEEEKPNPVSEYAKSKYLAEVYLESLNFDRYLIARFAPVYGKDFMKDIYKRIYLKYPTVAFKIGKGINYHFLSVNNINDFILKWIENRDRYIGTFNVCDDELVNSSDFIELEQKYGNLKVVIKIPEIVIELLNIGLSITSKIMTNKIVEKIQLNVHKLIRPNRYSNEKMKNMFNAKWNINNTIYKINE